MITVKKLLQPKYCCFGIGCFNRYLSTFHIVYKTIQSELNSYDMNKWTTTETQCSPSDKTAANINSYDFENYKKQNALSPDIIYKDFMRNIIQFNKSLHEIKDLYDNNEIDNDVNAMKECQELLNDLDIQYKDLRLNFALSQLSHMTTHTIFSTGDHYQKQDTNPQFNDSICYLEIHAGVGGEDSFDWVSMLYRMFSKWLKNKRNFNVTVIDVQSSHPTHTHSINNDTNHGDSSIDKSNHGFRHITLKISGKHCFAWLRTLAGTHRLVRISPFDPQHKRHTSFANILIYPEINDSQSSLHHLDSSTSSTSTTTTTTNNNNNNNSTMNNSINKSKIEEINKLLHSNDLKIETKRASGAGGQHVNTTDSAVRITHIPTGIVVSCQNERSQHKNKATAMTMLQSKLNHKRLEQQKTNRSDFITSSNNSINTNNTINTNSDSHIISLVMQPYQLVKDHRTNYQSSNIDNYLNGGDTLTDVLEGYLLYREKLITRPYSNS